MKTLLHKVINRFLHLIGFKIVKIAKSKSKNISYDISRYDILNSYFEIVMKNSKITKPWYAWGVLCGVDLAKTLNYKKISIIEFGVAGGAGLVELEDIVDRVEKIYDLKLDIFGFDMGTGLPKPIDYRDLPHIFQEGSYPMDSDKLIERLHHSKVILGPIDSTIIDFIKGKPNPVAFIAFDMDLYSSTIDSFKLLESEEDILLPRIHCYFDDIMGYSYSDYNGERLAIIEFNETHKLRKISPIYGLDRFIRNKPVWAENIYMIHNFDHSLYSFSDGMSLNPILPLNT